MILRKSILSKQQCMFSSISKQYQSIFGKIDLSKPHLWYPNTRRMRRKIVLHHGPTNSGKTYSALQALKSSTTGIYLGPLRLLAWEIATTLREDYNIPTNLLTGQENEMTEFAKHLSCTVEMCDFQNQYEVCVIDEVQLIGDRNRGFAFTNAILGVQASEIHLCGSSNVLPILQKICSQTDDELIEKKYDRLSRLKVSTKPLKSLSQVESGDCIVGFGRRTLYDIKNEVQKSGGPKKISVVYGNLPPVARKEQARLFSENENNILVATDAIGMGLNLSINRIIFTTVEKFDGKKRRLLNSSEIKQIGGRAGRGQVNGVITCLDKKGLDYIDHCLKIEDKPITRAGLYLNFDVIELLQLFIDNNVTLETMKLFWIDFMNRELNDDYDATIIAENLSHQGLSIAIINKYFNSFENFKRLFKLFLIEGTVQISKEGRRAASFSTILKLFKAQHEIQESKIYFLCDLDEMIEIAREIDHVPFNSLKDRYIFCSAPVKNDNKIIIDNFILMAEDFVKRRKVFLKINTSAYNVSTPEKLFIVESYYQVMEIYLWLSNKYGILIFPDKALCEDELLKLNTVILEALKRFNLSKKEVEKKRKEMKNGQKNEKKIIDLLDY